MLWKINREHLDGSLQAQIIEAAQANGIGAGYDDLDLSLVFRGVTQEQMQQAAKWGESHMGKRERRRQLGK